MNGPEKKGYEEFRTAVTMTVVWVGGLTLAIIFLALFGGILLDKLLDSKPVFTILLVVASVPLTIYLTLRVVRAATNRIKKPVQTAKHEEETQRGGEN
jgi:F0F1-type ATP synthase assembly protein I